MINISDFTKLEGENFHQYTWRMDELIRSGKYLNWKTITPMVNEELFGDDISQYRDESAYRKAVKYARDYYEAGVFGAGEEEYYEKLQAEKRELRLLIQRMSDERVEINRIYRAEGRKKSFLELVQQVICENTEPIDIKPIPNYFESDNDLLCHFTDIHTGIEIDNWKNKFDKDVLRERVKRYTENVLDIRRSHNSENCHIVIGEIISGLIHNNLRLQNNMNLMEQFKYISELISAMLIIFAENFSGVHVYITPGNHSRIVANKNDSLDGENMDVLLPFYLEARLQNIENIIIHENTIEPEIAMFNIRNSKVFAAHGHRDSVSNVVQNFTLMFGIRPDIVLLGHRHTNGMTTIFDTKVIESGCVSGTDQHAMSIRKCNKPEQTVSVIDNNGLKCLYDIQLD